jgi:hypothetical protein
MARVLVGVGWLEFRTVVRPGVTDSDEDSLNAAFAFKGRAAVMMRATSANWSRVMKPVKLAVMATPKRMGR